MWKVLIPIILLVVALLFQLQVRESFTATTFDASGNPMDASGNVTQAAGSTITLTLADLLSLFKASAGTGATTSGTSTGGTTSTMFYTTTTTTPSSSGSSQSSSASQGTQSTGSNSMVDGVSSSNLAGSPYTPSSPIPSEAPCSDAAAQGLEFQNALQDYIKKDEIPCYGCTL